MSEEGKWLHDQCGGGNKGAYKRGVKQNKIGFNSDQPFSESIKSFLESHFNQSRFNNSKIKRYFFTIDPKEISTQPSPHSTLNGIMSFHCFSYISKNIIR